LLVETKHSSSSTSAKVKHNPTYKEDYNNKRQQNYSPFPEFYNHRQKICGDLANKTF